MAELLESGATQAEIADRLGVSPPTVCFHMRRLGVPAQPGPARRYDWQEIAAYYAEGHSARQCRARFGCALSAWADAVRRGLIDLRPRLIPEEELFIAGRPRCRQHLKVRLLKAGLKTEHCEECGLTNWLGEPLSFELHHINGDGEDNRLENLQLLCPNCHSQTDTWGARNKGRAAM